MKGASLLNTVQCFTRLRNISWKMVRPSGADPARTTSGANPSGQAQASSRLRISFPSPYPSSLFLPLPDSRRNPASLDFVPLGEMPGWQILRSPAFADAPHLKWPTPSSDRFRGRKFLVGKSIEFLTDFLFWGLSHFLHFAGPGERKERGIPPCPTLIVNTRPRLSFRDRCFRRQICRTRTIAQTDNRYPGGIPHAD
jgi:hypothetical protein